MPRPAEPHPPLDPRHREADPWPFVVALAVIGPFALAMAIAVLVAIAR